MSIDLKPDATSKAVVPVLACVLNQLCQRNDRLPMDTSYVSKFHALRPPMINVHDYLDRISKYAGCSGECFVLALIYIDRIIQSNPTFVVNSLNIHRLLITSVMLGAKFFDDQYFNNAYYAKVGGVQCHEINLLEVEFLFMTNFTLFVTTDTYRQYYTELCNHALHSNCQCSSMGLQIPPLELKFNEMKISNRDQQQVRAPTNTGMQPFPQQQQQPSMQQQQQQQQQQRFHSQHHQQQQFQSQQQHQYAFASQQQQQQQQFAQHQQQFVPYQPNYNTSMDVDNEIDDSNAMVTDSPMAFVSSSTSPPVMTR